jgi:glycosyltransferase involved in cell wall biosynthesis
MTVQWEQWQREKYQYPGHHLWGATLLPKYGTSVKILSFEQFTLLKKFSQKIKFLGDLDQQFRLIYTMSEYDIVYSGHHLTTSLLGFLRCIGVFKKPIVAIAYQSFNKNIWTQLFTKFFLAGHDKLLCLNNEIKKHLKQEFNVPESKLEVLEWGNDLPFYPVDKNPDIHNITDSAQYIFSTGVTYRDYETLITAFKKINYPLKIHSGTTSEVSNTSFIPDISELTTNINLIQKWLSWKDMLGEYENAYAVAIPLRIRPEKPYNAIGLTSLLEAMSMQKAIVMTRNEFVGIDIEKQGIGIFVDNGDVRGWQQAISYLLAHPEETQEMGMRARHLCEKKYNLEVFTAKLSRSLKNLVN